MNSTTLIEESLTSIEELLHISVEGLGWAYQKGYLSLLGIQGSYFMPADVQLTVQGQLAALITPNCEARIFPASQIGLNSNRTLALLPSDPTYMGESDLTTIGLLLALPPDATLTTKQWESLCSIAKLTGSALHGIYALEASRRRQVRLATVATVGRDATILLDPDDLLNRVAQLISQQFGFYHVGIFLVDDTGQYAVLHASNSEYGKQLLEHNHRLKIGEQGMVGYVTFNGQPHIAADVGNDDVHYVNPFLPNTQSEITLPMYYGGQVIGALDVQSTEAGAFTQEDCTTLQIMADQLANALINARLHGEVRKRLNETRWLREIMVQASTLNQQEVLKKSLDSLLTMLPFPYQTFLERYGRAFVTTAGSCWPQSIYAMDLKTPLQEIWDRLPVWHSTSPQNLKWIGDRNIRAASIIPIRNQEKTLALLAVATPNAQQMQPRDQNFLETLAAQLSILLQNAEHHESTIQSQQLLQSIIKTEESMTATREVPLILEILCDTLLEKFVGTVEIAIYAQNHEQGNALEWAKQAAHPELSQPSFIGEFIDLEQMNILDYCLIWDTTAGAEQKTGSLFPHMLISEHIQHLPPHYVMIQPLQTPEQKVGFVIITVHQEQGTNLENYTSWIQTLANQAALTLSNAQLISQLKIQTHELGIACEEAQHLNKVRAQMLQNVSHELRTPLGIILGYAGILMEQVIGKLNPQQLELVQMINSRAQNLNHLIQNLISLQGKLQASDIVPIALLDLIKNVLQEFQEFAREQNIQFFIEAPHDMPLIQGDTQQLHLAFTHLIENAIKFSPDGGNVFIQMWAEAHWVIITFQDQGIGIPAEHLERIFDRFYQVDGSTTRKFGGMGVGLALVWDIIEAHQGQIQVQSTEGEGSTFLIALPHELNLDKDKQT